MGSRYRNIWVVIFCLLAHLLLGLIVATHHQHEDGLKVINIGVFIDSRTRIGKEQRVGMEIAAEEFNNNQSLNVRMELVFQSSNTNSNPFQAAYSAIRLIEEKRIDAIITGIENSEEVSLLGEIGTQYKVPILALSTAAVDPNVVLKNNSFLVQMGNNDLAQLSCIKSLILNFGWKKVIVVYEDSDGNGSSTSLMLDEFSHALQEVGLKIEYRLVLPPLALMPNPKETIMEEFAKVLNMQPRVFVVLRSSLPMTIQLFKEAYDMGLMGRETAWIVTNNILSLFDNLNSSTKSYMQGALGLMTYYDEDNQNFVTFSRKFLLKFLTLYPYEHNNPHPGSHALLAYDAVTTINKAIERRKSETINNSISPDRLLKDISSSDFNGLSGKISIKDGALKDDMVYKIINVVGKSYKELSFWSQKNGFCGKVSKDCDGGEISNEMLEGMVNWPGNIKHVPKGWTLASSEKPLKIGLPGRPAFDKLVMVEHIKFQNNTSYYGFCIDVFLEALKIVEQSYGLSYEFELFDGTYDELVDRVHDKTYDIAVGDITINANRSKFVEFTQPYSKSGLAMIVPLKSKKSQKELMFMKPFSWQLWSVSLAILLYTMFAVWWIECRNTSNSDFEGHWTNQLNTALWFTLSSLFFAQKENIKSNLTRIIVVTWLFVVFVLTSSYNASLTSMLTVPLLKASKVKDVEWLIRSNSPVGCDGGAVWDYLVNELHFNPKNVVNVSSQYDYEALFANDSIAVAFLERPYLRFLVNQNCQGFTVTKQTFGFGGHGFVFQKGSPIVGNISKAILRISENGVLKELQDKWFPIASECTTASNNHEVERLNPTEFLVLYIIYGTILAVCFMFYIGRRIKAYQATGNDPARSRIFWNWIIQFAQHNNQVSPVVLTISTN